MLSRSFSLLGDLFQRDITSRPTGITDFNGPTWTIGRNFNPGLLIAPAINVSKVNIDYTIKSKHTLGLSWWGLSDTGTTWLNVNNVDLIEPPFGYSREEYAAQERLGRWLGQEIDLDLSLALSDAISLNTTAAALLPGDFYAIETERVAGDQLGGTETAWAIASGIRAEF